MSTTVESIPWMPEKAWTTARAKCAISGLTRCGFTPDHVQIDPPCEGPAECVPPVIIVEGYHAVDMTPPGTGTVTVYASDIDDGSEPAWLYEWEVGDLEPVEGTDLSAMSVNLNCDHLGTIDFILRGWTENYGCFSEDAGVIDLTDTQGACGVAAFEHTPVTPRTADSELPRYYVWVERPRTPDFEGGEPGIVWSREEQGGHL